MKNTYKASACGKTLGEFDNMKDACKCLWNHIKKMFAEGYVALQILETAVWVEGPLLGDESEHSTSVKGLKRFADNPDTITASISNVIDAMAVADATSLGKQVWMFYDMRDYCYDQGWIDQDTTEFVD